jgi:hypothetical protein
VRTQTGVKRGGRPPKNSRQNLPRVSRDESKRTAAEKPWANFAQGFAGQIKANGEAASMSRWSYRKARLPSRPPRSVSESREANRPKATGAMPNGGGDKKSAVARKSGRQSLPTRSQDDSKRTAAVAGEAASMPSSTNRCTPILNLDTSLEVPRHTAGQAALSPIRTPFRIRRDGSGGCLLAHRDRRTGQPVDFTTSGRKTRVRRTSFTHAKAKRSLLLRAIARRFLSRFS